LLKKPDQFTMNFPRTVTVEQPFEAAMPAFVTAFFHAPNASEGL
jgi:hypothetical protein